MDHQIVKDDFGRLGLCGNVYSKEEKEHISFDEYWETCGYWYEEKDISKEDFSDFSLSNGFRKGDILIVWGRFTPKVGDIIIFKPNLDRDKIGEIKQKYGLDTPYFFYIGRLEKKKNVLGLVNAFNKISHSGANLVLAGNPGFGYGNIEKAIKNNSKIKTLGWVDQKDVPYLMAGAEALVMPSYYEGFCMPVLEAMAVGTPVIGSNNTAIPEIAAGAAILIDPRDTNDLAEAMDRILENEELKQELTATGLERVRDFSWQKCAQETLKIITSK